MLIPVTCRAPFAYQSIAIYTISLELYKFPLNQDLEMLSDLPTISQMLSYRVGVQNVGVMASVILVAEVGPTKMENPK